MNRDRPSRVSTTENEEVQETKKVECPWCGCSRKIPNRIGEFCDELCSHRHGHWSKFYRPEPQAIRGKRR